MSELKNSYVRLRSRESTQGIRRSGAQGECRMARALPSISEGRMHTVRVSEGQTGRVLYWESGFSFVFLTCMATYVSPYVAIVPCVCVRLFMCHTRLRRFFF